MESSSNAIVLIQALYSVFWYVLAVSIVRFVLLEYKLLGATGETLSKMQRSEMLDKLWPLWPRVRYIVGGALLSYFSYLIATHLYRIFPDVTEAGVNLNVLGNANVQMICFLFVIIGFTLSGYFLMISLGTKWLLNLSKLLATISVLIIVAITIGSYIPF